MDIGSFLQKLCSMLKELFFASYGDSQDSAGGDLYLAPGTDWIQIASVNNPCILMFRNLDPIAELMITWRKENSTGYRIAADTSFILDGVSGIIYCKPADPLVGLNINFLIISKKVNDV